MLQSRNMVRSVRKTEAVPLHFTLSMNARQSLEARGIAPDRFLAAMVRARKKILVSETGHLMVRIGDLWAVAKKSEATYEVLIVMSHRDARETLGLSSAKPNAA